MPIKQRQATLPKVASKAKGKTPSTGVENKKVIRNTLNDFVASAIGNIKTQRDVNKIIKMLMREDGLFSSSANSMAALASRSGFRVAGFDSSGKMSLEVTSAAYNILDSLDTQHDYSKGYNDKRTLQSLLATLMIDVIGTGGCAAELVMDDDRFPNSIVPIGYSTITWKSDGKGGRFPSQDGGVLELNLPTVFVAEHNRLADEAYAVSQLRPGLEQTFAFNEFLEDTHRSLNRTGHSRLISTISQEAATRMAPPEYQTDPDKMAAFYNDIKSQVEEALRDLEPEDALVSYDVVSHKVEDTGGNKADYSTLLTTLGNLLGVSLKTPATVSGLRSAGSEALSNAETLIYLKVVDASRPPVEEVISRAVTLSLQLLGVDGYVKFVFNPINLRPETELEAYLSSRQKRVLEQLSYGVISDAQACFDLGIRPQELNAALSGTLFYTGSTTGREEGERTTSSGRALNPDTPSSSGGGDR